MPEVSFSGLLLVAAAAFAAPLLVALVPHLRLPAVVLEILFGIAIGPAGLGWVETDEAIDVFALFGLAILLFLAGLEVEPERFRGRPLVVAGGGFLVSLVLALIVGFGLGALGVVETPPFLAIMLVATSLGLIIPVLKDAGQVGSEVGQLTIAGSSIADFAAVILLSLLFSSESTGVGAKLVLLGGFLLLAAVAGVAVAGAGRSMRLSDALYRLQDTTAQIRVRGAIVMLVGFLAMAQRLGLEVILAAFIAGAILKLVDRDVTRTHPNFHLKLEAIGYGFFIPVYFVASGVRFDLGVLFGDPGVLLRVPLYLFALLAVRGIPALLYRPVIGQRPAVAAGLLQATSLPFIVAGTQIGVELEVIGRANAAALVAAGLLSVVIFPLAAVTLLRPRQVEPEPSGHAAA
jgi:Kef-type K+ transport system membrane component KefB